VTTQLLLGLLLGAAIGALAWRMRALTPSGAWAAAVTGGLVFGLGGLPWAILLLVFFVTSSGLSRAFAQRKRSLEQEYAKGSRRDWGQVLANGALGALLAAAQAFIPGQDWPWVAFAGAMAAVNADTWATELGVFNPGLPRRITTGKKVEKGVSGGVSLVGYLAALAGAGLVGIAALFFTPSGLPLLAAITLGGLAGSTVDSLLGATLQTIYWCPDCRKETERHPQHTCGSPTTRLRGWRWMNNDVVNFICSLAGGLVALGVWIV